MNIKLYGSNRMQDQLPRIQSGLIELGHTIVSDPAEAELIYSNDPGGYENAISDSLHNENCTLILNVQDIPYHLWKPEHFDAFKNVLINADIVTCISESVQHQIKYEFDIDATIIYQPIKPISNLKLDKEIDFLLVGRLNDPNKYSHIALKVIERFKSVYPKTIAVSCGSEDLNNPLVNHLGLVSDEVLNELYNRSKFVLCFGEVEGMCLPICEALAAHSVPICLNHNITAFEFCPIEFISTVDINQICKIIFTTDQEYQQVLDTIVIPTGSHYKQKFSSMAIAQNIIDSYNNFKSK